MRNESSLLDADKQEETKMEPFEAWAKATEILANVKISEGDKERMVEAIRKGPANMYEVFALDAENHLDYLRLFVMPENDLMELAYLLRCSPDSYQPVTHNAKGNLRRLWQFTGEPRFKDAAKIALKLKKI